MNYTILSLDNILAKAKKIVNNIPVEDIQKRWDKFVKTTTDSINASYFDHIETLHLKMKDMEEANNRLTLTNAELQSKIIPLIMAERHPQTTPRRTKNAHPGSCEEICDSPVFIIIKDRM